MPRSSFFWNMATILCAFVRTHVFVERTRLQAMPLTTMTMKTQTHGSPIFYASVTVMGLHSVAPRSLGSSAMKLYMNFQLQNWQCGNLKCIIDFLENKSIFSQIKYAVILFHGKAYIWSEYKRNPFSNTCRVLSDRVGDIGSKVSISSTNYIQNVTLLYFCLDCLNVQWRP